MERAIIKAVTAVTGITMEQMCSPDRHASVVTARHFAMYLVYRDTTLSTNEVGRLFHRDHASVLHALKNVLNGIRYNRAKRRTLEMIIKLYTLGNAEPPESKV